MDMSRLSTNKVAPFGRSAAPDGDYRVLVARLQALQLATATARAGSRAAPAAARPAPGQPLTDILGAHQGWEEAVTAQAGSFNPRLARVSEGG
jgi:hypothetical protein